MLSAPAREGPAVSGTCAMPSGEFELKAPIRMRNCSECHLQESAASTCSSRKRRLPIRSHPVLVDLGHEDSRIVEAVGDEIRHARPDDRLRLASDHASGIIEAPETRRPLLFGPVLALAGACRRQALIHHMISVIAVTCKDLLLDHAVTVRLREVELHCPFSKHFEMDAHAIKARRVSRDRLNRLDAVGPPAWTWACRRQP